MENTTTYTKTLRRALGSLAACLGAICLSSLNIDAFAAPYSEENAAYNVNLNPDGSDPSRYYGGWEGHDYFPSPDDWRKIPVYQIMTDRFRDGDPSNNDGQFGGFDIYDVAGRQGGDFQGIIDKLDYVKGMGFKAIWISPVYQNDENSYHNYRPIDFTIIEDRFGSLEELRNLVTEAHNRGLYVIFDIVINHMADLYYFEGHQTSTAPFQMHEGEYQLFQHPNKPFEYVDFSVDNRFFTDGKYPDVYDSNGEVVSDDDGEGSFWFSDFHHNGNLRYWNNPYEGHLGKMFDLDDLRTTHPRVRNKLIAMSKALMSSTDIDGMRIDAPMQVPLEFLKEWSPEIREHAQSLGKDNFFMFGEFFAGRGRSATMIGRGKTPDQHGTSNTIDARRSLDSGLNYEFYWWLEEAVERQNDGNLSGLLNVLERDKEAYDLHVPSRNNDYRYRELQFFNNHDQERLSFATDGAEKSKMAAGIIASWPGIPSWYYGDEQAFETQLMNNETGLEFGWVRENMMTSVAWSGPEAATVNGGNPSEIDNFNMTHPNYLWIQKLLNARNKYWNLQICDSITERYKQANDANGIYAFSRKCGSDKDDWLFITFNTWRQGITKFGDIRTGFDGGDTIVNILNPSERYTVTGEGGFVQDLYVGGYGFKIFAREQGLQTLDPVVEFVSPSHDDIISGQEATITIRFDSAMSEASVKSAFRFNGQNVASSALAWNADARELTYTAPVTPGIHKIEILDTAESLDGLRLISTFSSRFRSGGNDNVIMNPEVGQNNNLIEVVNASSGEINLHHNAAGASYLRVKADSDFFWGPWVPYQSVTQARLGYGEAPRSVQVQYWADGSAAYIVTDEVNVAIELPSLNIRGTHNDWANDPMTFVGEGLWVGDVTFSEAGVFKFDVHGDWLENYGDSDQDGLLEPEGLDITINTPGTYSVVVNASNMSYNVYPSTPYADVFFRGTPNNFGLSPMTQIASNVWQIDVAFTGEENDRFKFDMVGDWTENYGDEDTNGYIDLAGEDIFVHMPGNYTITLIGDTGQYLLVENNLPIPPNANAGSDISVKEGATVQFDASSSTDVDGQIISYVWSNGLTGVSPALRYNTPGEYTVELVVTDNDQLTDADSVLITVVANQAPVANAGADVTVKEGATVVLDGSGSFDNDGTIQTYLWSNGSAQVQTNLLNLVPGSYSYQLTVTDDNGATSIDEVIVNVIANVAPSAVISSSVDEVKEGGSITFDASGSSDSDGTIVQYSWSNGSISTSTEITYSDPGTYSVELTVTDDNGATSTTTYSITVIANLPPVVGPMPDLEINAGETLTINAPEVVDNDGEVVENRWESSVFDTLVGESISVTFETPGTEVIQFTAIDDNGATTTVEFTVTVLERPDNWQRTVILIYGRTEQGQDMFFRGGIDSNWSNSNRGTNCTSQVGGDHNIPCSIGIRHLNTLHAYTAPWRNGDNYLDWGKLTSARNGRESSQTGTNAVGELAEGTPAIWTTNNCASNNVYSESDLTSSCASSPNLYGGGFTDLNDYGDHYWILDVEMNCDDTVDGWFEFKSFISNGPGWEQTINQTQFGGLTTPRYTSGNHFAACGMVNVFRRNQNNPVDIKSF